MAGLGQSFAAAQEHQLEAGAAMLAEGSAARSGSPQRLGSWPGPGEQWPRIAKVRRAGLQGPEPAQRRPAPEVMAGLRSARRGAPERTPGERRVGVRAPRQQRRAGWSSPSLGVERGLTRMASGRSAIQALEARWRARSSERVRGSLGLGGGDRPRKTRKRGVCPRRGRRSRSWLGHRVWSLLLAIELRPAHYAPGGDLLVLSRAARLQRVSSLPENMAPLGRLEAALDQPGKSEKRHGTGFGGSGRLGEVGSSWARVSRAVCVQVLGVSRGTRGNSSGGSVGSWSGRAAGRAGYCWKWGRARERTPRRV